MAGGLELMSSVCTTVWLAYATSEELMLTIRDCRRSME
jgi:hypothetical protein